MKMIGRQVLLVADILADCLSEEEMGVQGEGMWLAARSVDVLVLSGRSEKAGAFLQNLL